MESRHRNRNRGYRQLRVWQDAIALYKMTYDIFHDFPYATRRVASQQIASADSVHRNIAEGYFRRSIPEYLNFVNYALGSMGETVSGLHANANSDQIDAATFDQLDEIAFRLENGLLNLRDSLQRQDPTAWSERKVVRESNAVYDT